MRAPTWVGTLMQALLRSVLSVSTKARSPSKSLLEVRHRALAHGRGSQGQPLPAGQRLEVVAQEKQHGVPDDARAAQGALLEDVVVLQPVRPQGLLPHEDEDLHPPEGLDVVKVHGAVRRQAREVHPSVGQSGLPARGARSSAAGQLGVAEGARAAHGLFPLGLVEAVGEDAPHEAARSEGSRWPSSWPGSRAAPSSSLPPRWAAGARACRPAAARARSADTPP